MGNQNPQVLIDDYREQIDWSEQRIGAYDQELANWARPGKPAADVYHNMLVQERNTVDRRAAPAEQPDQQPRRSTGPIPGAEATVQRRGRPAPGVIYAGRQRPPQGGRRDHGEVRGAQIGRRGLKGPEGSFRIVKVHAEARPVEGARDAPSSGWEIRGLGAERDVELHREDGVDHVDVMLNGKGRSGWSSTPGPGRRRSRPSSPHSLNLKPTGRTVDVRGRRRDQGQAKEMIIRTVRVGRLTVKNVTCVVMPREKGDVDPLLGQSFLQRFDFKYTQGSGRLVLTKVEPDEPASPREGQRDQEEALIEHAPGDFAIIRSLAPRRRPACRRDAALYAQLMNRESTGVSRMIGFDAERNLLVGTLAFQTGLIDQNALASACRVRADDKEKSLAELLVDQGALDVEGKSLIEALASKQLWHARRTSKRAWPP